MKADLGILLLLLGFTLAYLVLAGKIPLSIPIASSATSTSNPAGNVGTTQASLHNPAGNNAGTGSGPGGTTSIGLPTMGYFHDLVASQGGMQ